MTDTAQTVGRILNQPGNWDFSGARDLYAGVDVGTHKIKLIVVDEMGIPRAASMRQAEVVQSGLIVDYTGALKIVRELIEEMRGFSTLPLEKGATSYPPETESGNIHTTRYILEAVGLEVLNVLDEPTAANLVLNLDEGAIVDVGGGTTGIAVVHQGKVVYTNDEATGGVHLSLVLAGSLKVSYEEAERIKTDERRNGEIFPIVLPVVDKISSIVYTHIRKFRDLRKVCMVGGTCELGGLTERVGRNLGLEAFRPPAPQVITPLGIALSCLQENGRKTRV
jgi:ethanolamine utilization protein EutJ